MCNKQQSRLVTRYAKASDTKINNKNKDITRGKPASTHTLKVCSSRPTARMDKNIGKIYGS